MVFLSILHLNFFNFPMLLESFTLHQMTFSTSLYKFYPCLQSWSIYSSMAHITIGHTVISLWILSISLLCLFHPHVFHCLIPKDVFIPPLCFWFLYCFFHVFLLDGLGVFAHHTAWKKFPFRLCHWTKSYSSDMHTDWNSVLSKRAT